MAPVICIIVYAVFILFCLIIYMFNVHRAFFWPTEEIPTFPPLIRTMLKTADAALKLNLVLLLTAQVISGKIAKLITTMDWTYLKAAALVSIVAVCIYVGFLTIYFLKWRKRNYVKDPTKMVDAIPKLLKPYWAVLFTCVIFIFSLAFGLYAG